MPVPDSQNESRSAAARHYAEAYDTHYARRDLAAALQTYENVVALHPGAPEAEYARAQIRNIVSHVVPADRLLAALIELTRSYMQPSTGDAAEPEVP